MKDTTKARLAKLKEQVKKNAPTIVSTAVAAVAAGMAAYYRHELNKTRANGPDDWPFIRVSPGEMANIEEGAVLKYRQVRDRRNNYHIQSTTYNEFSAEMNKRFEEAGGSVEPPKKFDLPDSRKDRSPAGENEGEK